MAFTRLYARGRRTRDVGASFFAASLLTMVLTAAADTVWVGQPGKGSGLPFDGVRVMAIEGGTLTYQSISSGNRTNKALTDVIRIHVDGENAFNAAEDAFDKQDWPASVEGYKKAMQVSANEVVKARATQRLVDAASKSGSYSDAVAAFIQQYLRDPTTKKPPIDKSKPAALKPAAADVEKAASDPRLKSDQRAFLLSYAVEIYTAAGESRSAEAALKNLSTIQNVTARTGTAGAGVMGADIVMAQLAVAVQNQDWAKVKQTVDSGRASITEPAQQVDALYDLAMAQEQLAKSDPKALQDAAIAYLRVVAHFDGRVASPNIALSLMKAAGIEERLSQPTEAMTLYSEVVTRFKESSPSLAAEAAKARDRLAKAKAG